MKKTNFLEQLESIASQAETFIKKNVKEGKTVVFLSDEDRENNGDLLYELPVASQVTKHGFYDEFGIVSISKENDEIKFSGICKGEGDDDDNLSLGDLDNTSICAIADLLSKKIK